MYHLKTEIKFNKAVMGYFKGRGFTQGITLLEYLRPKIENEMKLIPPKAKSLLKGSYRGWETDGLARRIGAEIPKISNPQRIGNSYCILGRIFDQKKLDNWCKERTSRAGKTSFPYWRVIEEGAKAHLIDSMKLMPIHLRSFQEVYGTWNKSDKKTFGEKGFILRWGPFQHPGYKGIGFIRRSRYDLRRMLKRLVPVLVGMQLTEALGRRKMVQVAL